MGEAEGEIEGDWLSLGPSDGDSVVEDGSADKEGAPVGLALGLVEMEGAEDLEGESLGSEVGLVERDGLRDGTVVGWTLGSVERDGTELGRSEG